MFTKRAFFFLLVISSLFLVVPGTRATPAQSQENKKKSDSDTALGSVASTGLSQNVVPASELSNSELLARSRSIYVTSDTVFVKKEDMEKYLLRQKELEDFRLHVVQNKQDADLVLQIKRVAFTNNFPYSISDRASSIVVMQGEIDALPSKVPAKIAAALAEKLKEANGKKPEQQQVPAK